MKINEAYDLWSSQYDTNKNRTRDLEKVSMSNFLHGNSWDRCLEIGCGTGINTVTLQNHCNEVVAVDFSEKMLSIAQSKIDASNITFHQFDILNPWTFTNKKFDLVVFSLVLEHIKDIKAVFQKSYEALNENGHIYIGELHPLKQYNSSKARFESENGTIELTCYTHHFSEYWKIAQEVGFTVVKVEEYFDDANKLEIPRILNLILRK